MSLFEAPGWDSGLSKVTATTSTPGSRKSNKRKRAPGAGLTSDSDASAPLPGSSPNIQKLMRKLQIEQNRKNSAMERLKPSESAAKALKARQRSGLNVATTSMDPPSSSLAFNLPSSSPSNSPTSSVLAPSSKKRKVQREESDVLPPSSAGDDTEPSFSLPKNKKRKKTKRVRTSSNGESATPVFVTSNIVDSEDEQSTSRPGTAKGKGKAATPSSPESDATSDEYAGLTKMQREMKQRLSGGRFRMINELLYKSDSGSAHDMMRKDPSTFDEYHNGFRNQVQSWPINPVSYFTKSVSASHPARSTIIADLGCGDASLAKALNPKGFKVLSFDLVSDDEWVIEADICAKLPLPGSEETGSGKAETAQVVDICVCALSLMSTNWVRCVREARRVLKTKGSFMVAEVTSRFPDVDAFVALICSIGFELTTKSEPSTHFMIFEFQKSASAKRHSKQEWSALEAKGKALLTPCEYKRR